MRCGWSLSLEFPEENIPDLCETSWLPFREVPAKFLNYRVSWSDGTYQHVYYFMRVRIEKRKKNCLLYVRVAREYWWILLLEVTIPFFYYREWHTFKGRDLQHDRRYCMCWPIYSTFIWRRRTWHSTVTYVRTRFWYVGKLGVGTRSLEYCCSRTYFQIFVQGALGRFNFATTIIYQLDTLSMARND